MTQKALLLSADAPPTATGAAVYLHELARRNADLVDLLAPDTPNAAEFDRAVPYRVHRIKLPRRDWTAALHLDDPLLAAAFYRRAGRLIKSQRYGLLLAGDAGPAAAAAMMLGLRRRLPWGLFLHRDVMARPCHASRLLARMLVFRANVAVASSDYARQAAASVGRRLDRIPVLRPGADPLRYRPGDPPEQLLTRYGLHRRRVLLTVGRLVPSKGHDVMIRTLAHVAGQIGDVLYLVVGDGPQRSRLEKLAAAEGVADRVVFTGLVHNDQLPGLYHAADLYVGCSRPGEVWAEDSFGLAFIEAAASGLPAVGPAVGPEADIILHGRTGLQVNVADPAAVAAAVVALLNDPDRLQAMSTAAAEHAASRFNWAESAARLGRLIEATSKR